MRREGIFVLCFEESPHSWYLEIPSHLTAPNYRADLRQGVAVEYVSCEPTQGAHELFDEEYEPVEDEQ